eukprot:m.5852 g.5852  ORF g.5852 m.5852 type:complete len:243 (+) comp3421_c0_seq1:146-874(+)
MNIPNRKMFWILCLCLVLAPSKSEKCNDRLTQAPLYSISLKFTSFEEPVNLTLFSENDEPLSSEILAEPNGVINFNVTQLLVTEAASDTAPPKVTDYGYYEDETQGPTQLPNILVWKITSPIHETLKIPTMPWPQYNTSLVFGNINVAVVRFEDVLGNVCLDGDIVANHGLCVTTPGISCENAACCMGLVCSEETKRCTFNFKVSNDVDEPDTPILISEDTEEKSGGGNQQSLLGYLSLCWP